MVTKKCKQCCENKSISDFYIQKNNIFGVQNYCKNCIKIKNKLVKELFGISVRTIARYSFKVAIEVYDRAKRKCEICGEINDLTIHHKDRKGRNRENKKLKQNNNIENLMVLCRKCHGSIHGKQAKGIKKNRNK